MWPIDETLTSTTAPSQSGPGSKDNEKVLIASLISRTGASSSDMV